MNKLQKFQFRARTVCGGEWVYGDLYRFGDDSLGIRYHAEIGGRPENIVESVQPNTVCRFLDCCDEDDTPIFEGDIVEATYIDTFDNHVQVQGIIGFEDWRFVLYPIGAYRKKYCEEQGFEYLELPCNYDACEVIRVIGNRFDGKEATT